MSCAVCALSTYLEILFSAREPQAVLITDFACLHVPCLSSQCPKDYLWHLGQESFLTNQAD